MRPHAGLTTTRYATVPIGSRLSGADNALNFLRLVLASAVIVAHTWPVGGFGTAPAFAGMSSGTWAVAGFFSISGYLIAGSRLRSRFWDYLSRRALRIFPGFWVCLIVIAFGFAPLSRVLGAPGSWSPVDGVRFVVVNIYLNIHEYNVGSTIHGNPYPLTWDDSLWTLFWEFSAYLVVGGLLGLAIFRRRMATCFAALLILTTSAYYLAEAMHITSGYVLNGSRLGASFVAGVLLYSLKDRLPASPRLFILSLALLLGIGLAGLPNLLVALPFAYALLYLGGTLPTRIGARNDVSYGVYIYAFPIQQLLATQNLQRAGELVFIVVAFVLTLPFAWLSWRLVERPGMKLRKKLRRRRRVPITSVPVTGMEAPVGPDSLGGSGTGTDL
ncbi:acyltransferase family protein [Flexivirga oryzae]|uniref:Peptidoglycan/LPS O-acetylase OafA/YrhL n=1 Tax=Flexivirga oryzae TaxID=1794944 RepID=A0A839N5W1_9MICO|nr:acyltransferase [Flexivirga oryzae]MBB2890141.1 peptidoglycan/LPS O-acetylase OafA/YrhL [Flexivirga oryzae]